MSEKNEEPGKPSPERFRIESLPGFDAVPRDMQDALERFNDDAQEIVYSFLATLELQQPPPIIYHYTNDVGLKGILETGQLWLTDNPLAMIRLLVTFVVSLLACTPGQTQSTRDEIHLRATVQNVVPLTDFSGRI